ncbi:adenylate/guanylate cyclase domain-containing protein [Jiella endophytica]|uniref:Adenylate/guanylate cyclase domain-containing protein n=1 Tax=Jiella endophytica TaxID=2558362 RepID=A0A4Y8RSR3_9HYPH|nr:adenylate/guanylate cyclase domain-containing protein [Jiella endophytica]TFF27276.1 adenylate/guanylate cyclase domain-containing protein [Jiella endophytica]
MELVRSAPLIRSPRADGQLLERKAIIDWLVKDTSRERFVDNIFQELCDRLRAAGMPVARATLHFRIQHPQWLGARILWRDGAPEVEIETFQHGVLESPGYLESPVARVHAGDAEVRWSVSDGEENLDQYPLFRRLRDEGLTEYFAWPLEHTLGRRHVITFASDAADGFSDDDRAFLSELLPHFALVSEIRLKNRLARTLLETYVGPHASEEILAGAITRGSGTTVAAAIIVCDLRDFTHISELWPRDDVIEILNGYFDAICEPIERHGGEILKFIGDGLLAIFPLDRPTACDDLLSAVDEAQAAMDALNAERERGGHEILRYGVGIHLGDVMYGNIGSRTRLDFTVIGPSVNAASRLESLTKTLKRPVLVSKAFAEQASCNRALESLGSYPLRGFGEEMEVFSFSIDRWRASMPEQAITAKAS